MKLFIILMVFAGAVNAQDLTGTVTNGCNTPKCPGCTSTTMYCGQPSNAVTLEQHLSPEEMRRIVQMESCNDCGIKQFTISPMSITQESSVSFQGGLVFRPNGKVEWNGHEVKSDEEFAVAIKAIVKYISGERCK